MAGLFEKINAEKTLVTGLDKFAKIGDSLFGSKPKVEPISIQEPEDNGNMAMPQIPFPEQPNYGGQNFNQRYSDQQMQVGRDFLNQQNVTQSQFRADTGIHMSNEWLRALAKMEVATLNLKSSLKTEPIRIATSMAFKWVHRPDISAEINSISLDDDLADFNNLLEEVVFQELKALQRANNLRIPPAAELMTHRTLMAWQKMAGEGFKNVMILGEEIFKKVSKPKTKAA